MASNNIRSAPYSYFLPYDPPWSSSYKFEVPDKPTSELSSNIGQLIRFRQHAPIYSLPFEVLSVIFEKVIEPGPDLNRKTFYIYRQCIRRAFVLCSVSRLFRQVALETPELWRRLPLWVASEKMKDVSALFRHSVPRALSLGLHISMLNRLGVPTTQELHESVMGILVSSGAACKVKLLDLSGSTSGPTSGLQYWVGFLSSFPNLDTLTVWGELQWDKDDLLLTYDLSSLLSLTRISVYGTLLKNFLFPSSLQILHFHTHTPSKSLIRMLYTCPNLLECRFEDRDLISYQGPVPDFTAPLTLKNLNRLTWRMDFGLQTPSSIQNLQIPSLEYLNLHSDFAGHILTPPAIILLCDHVSSTLTTLILSIQTKLWKDDYLRQLVHLPFQKLETLKFSTYYPDCMLGFIHVLDLDQDETQMICLPTLRFLTLRHTPLADHELLGNLKLASLLLNWLKRRTSSKTPFSDLTLDINGRRESVVDSWPVHLRHELFSMVKAGKFELNL